MAEKPLSQFKLARMQARGGQEARADGADAASSTVPVPAAPAAHAPAPAPHRSAAAASGGGSPQRRDGGVGVEGFPGRGEETVEQKVERYQRFVDETLRVKLAQALDQREEVVKEIEAYEKLRGTVEVMRESQTGRAKSMVNIGCELYMQTNIPDTSKIMVNVGLGFFVELTLAGFPPLHPLRAGAGAGQGAGCFVPPGPSAGCVCRGRRLTLSRAPEAADFVQTRCELLQARADKLSEEASEVNSQIEVLLLLAVAWRWRCVVPPSFAMAAPVTRRQRQESARARQRVGARLDAHSSSPILVDQMASLLDCAGGPPRPAGVDADLRSSAAASAHVPVTL
jgi:prefoldin subunit 5